MRKGLAFKSSIIGIVTKFAAVILAFVTNKLFVKYIGIEIQGINGVFTNIIGFLQLAELGIGSAITYALYKPIAEGNIDEIKVLMNFYKIVYRWIFGIVMILGIIMIPFLGLFIVDSTYSKGYLILVFYLQVMSTGVTYLLAYKRNLMYADQKQYIYTYIDSGVNISTVILRIIIIVFTKSYLAYLILGIFQYLIANIIVDNKCNKLYPYLKEKVTEKYDKMDELIGNLKNIMIGRIGGWVYSSTDNVIMSRFVGVVTVGMMTNYYILRNSINNLVGAVMAPIQPMIANYIRDNKSVKESYDLFLSYTFIRYVISNIVTVGFVTLANPVITVWLGEEYVLPQSIAILMAIDMFIGTTHGPTGEFVNALGLFHNDRNMSLVAMILNLVFSITLVYKLGAQGVLIGTVIAQSYYWFARGRIVFKNYFKQGVTEYILKILKYIIVLILEILLVEKLQEVLVYNLNWGIIFLETFVCTGIALLSIIISNFWTKEFKYLLKFMKEINNKVLNRQKE